MDAWSDRIYMSTDTFVDSGDLVLGTVSHSGALAPGESYTATRSVTLPHGVSGDFFFLVRTDVSDQVYEQLFESNNDGFDSSATTVNLLSDL